MDFINNELTINISDKQLDNLRSQLYALLLEEVSKVKHEAELTVRYLKKKEACNYLRVSNNTLDKWIALGLPQISVGGSVRYDRIALDQWMTKVAEDGRIKL